jgi:hypothetical protein
MTRIGLSQLMLVVVSTAAVIAACGSEPKKEPTAATASVPEVPPPATPEAGAAGPATGAVDAGAPATDKQAECDGLIDDANSALDAERIAVDKLCKKDADCVPIKGRACGFNCVTGAIPKAEEKEWNETLSKVKDGQCKKWNDNDCAKLKTKPVPTCQERKVWCDKGHCAVKEK